MFVEYLSCPDAGLGDLEIRSSGLDVGENSRCGLFFTRFAGLGFVPRSKKDRYTNHYEKRLIIIGVEQPLKRQGESSPKDWWRCGLGHIRRP